LNGKHVAEEKYPRHAKAVRDESHEANLALGAGIAAVLVSMLALIGVLAALAKGVF
jgi:hypothetical protein